MSRLSEYDRAMSVPLLRNGVAVTIETAQTNECRYMYAQEPSCEAPLCARPVIRPGISWCEHHFSRVLVKPGVRPKCWS